MINRLRDLGLLSADDSWLFLSDFVSRYLLLYNFCFKYLCSSVSSADRNNREAIHIVASQQKYNCVAISFSGKFSLGFLYFWLGSGLSRLGGYGLILIFNLITIVR